MSNVTPEDFIENPPEVFTGFPTDEELRNVYYGLMHGEDIWMNNGKDKEKWADEFIEQFCLVQVPYFYLNRYRRVSIKENGDGSYTGYFSGGVISDSKTQTITVNGIPVKDKDNVLLPVDETNRKYIAYSLTGKSGEWNIPGAKDGPAKIFRITPDGNIPAGETVIRAGKITLSVGSREGYAVEVNAQPEI